MKYRKMQQSKFGLPVTATGSTQKYLYSVYSVYRHFSVFHSFGGVEIKNVKAEKT